MQNIKEISKETLFSAKWLSLKNITYLDASGQERKWETVERTTRGNGGIDAVDIIATVHPATNDNSNNSNNSNNNSSNNAVHIILIKQYRPPVGRICVEFPAGLIDEGETPGQTAVRELMEETGYKGRVIHTSHELCYEPGMTNANTALVHVHVDAAENLNPKQCLESDECIEVMLVPLHKLFQTLQELPSDHVIDSKVYTYAYALEMAKKFPM